MQSAGREVTVGAEFSLRISLAAEPSARLERWRLEFPGFTATATAAARATGGIDFRGQLDRPGFHALAASARWRGRRVTGRDYFIAVPPKVRPAQTEAGYYVFLGCGDYPLITGRETHPLAAWTLAQWQELVTWMGANGMNRLWTLVNGYTLAYPSRRYPALRDRHARNAQRSFLRQLIDHAHRCGVKVYLMLTTDGHARDFSRAFPEAARRDAHGRPGAHFGLALEHPRTRRYIFDVLDEVLTLYPNADGVAVHPTESDPERFNPESLAAYREETSRDLRAEPPAVRRAWHNRAFARFMGEFADRCHRHNPGLDLVMANCWWQDGHVALNHALLPRPLRVAVWHYAWEDEVAKPWPIYAWVEAFGPRRILYVPTSQSYLYPTDPRRVMDRHLGTDRLVSTAAALGVRDTVYFAGWDILPEPARQCDVALVWHPTGALLRRRPAQRALIPQLYADYLGARAAALAKPSR